MEDGRGDAGLGNQGLFFEEVGRGMKTLGVGGSSGSERTGGCNYGWSKDRKGGIMLLRSSRDSTMLALEFLISWEHEGDMAAMVLWCHSSKGTPDLGGGWQRWKIGCTKKRWANNTVAYQEVETCGQIQGMRALAHWIGQDVILDTRIAMRRHGEC